MNEDTVVFPVYVYMYLLKFVLVDENIANNLLLFFKYYYTSSVYSWTWFTTLCYTFPKIFLNLCKKTLKTKPFKAETDRRVYGLIRLYMCIVYSISVTLPDIYNT